MKTPAVSVVIPAWNAAAFIEKTLDSVRAQTFTDYEIVVTDDGSSDDTKEVVDRYLQRHGLQGRCVRQQNKKIAGARNTGMREARAPYIALLDHDDFWYPQKLAKVMKVFAERPDVDLVGHHIDLTKDGRLVRVMRKGPAVPFMYEWLLFVGNAVTPSAAVFRRAKALGIGGFREDPQFNTVEDYDFWLRLSKVAKFYFINEALTEYPAVEQSASSRVDYHHGNLEAMLQDHFARYFGPTPGLVGRCLIRRRLAAVYRAAAGQLIATRAPRDRQSEYIWRMLKTFPFDPKNVARALLWALGQGSRG